MLYRTKGFKLVFYMIVLRNSNFYTMFEIYSFDVPQSFNSLPILMTSIHKIKQIIHMYQSHCVKRPPESPKRRRSRSMSKKEYSQIINYMKPKKMKPSLSFKWYQKTKLIHHNKDHCGCVYHCRYLCNEYLQFILNKSHAAQIVKIIKWAIQTFL